MPPSVLSPAHVDEPQAAQDYAEVFSRVAADHQPVIVRRGGSDLAAIVPLEYLELLEDVLAREQAERLAAGLGADQLIRTFPPPQSWFDGEEPKPF
jgi:PHD/YefM family antitoxin component YafN of YafNO toxin-antitoxin module